MATLQQWFWSRMFFGVMAMMPLFLRRFQQRLRDCFCPNRFSHLHVSDRFALQSSFINFPQKKNTVISFIPLGYKPLSCGSDLVSLSLMVTGFVMLPHHLSERALSVLKSLKMNFAFYLAVPFTFTKDAAIFSLFLQFTQGVQCSR